MSKVPANPKIYHITHINNLAKIVTAGGIWSDRQRLDQGLQCEVVGMPTIKKRRLEEIAVSCVPGTKVGDYVPFYLCPRSVMLFIFYKKNHPDLPYKGGQEPMVHLQADLNACAKWAHENGRPIAFSTSNAGALTADFYNQRKNLDKIDWEAVGSRQFTDSGVRERKQAEFLMHDWFPWSLVEHVGVFDQTRLDLASRAIAAGDHRPTVCIENGWYF
jgi:hypothetical protein